MKSSCIKDQIWEKLISKTWHADMSQQTYLKLSFSIPQLKYSMQSSVRTQNYCQSHSLKTLDSERCGNIYIGYFHLLKNGANWLILGCWSPEKTAWHCMFVIPHLAKCSQISVLAFHKELCCDVPRWLHFWCLLILLMKFFNLLF